MIATEIETGSLLTELELGWTGEDLRALEAEISPYTVALRDYMGSGEEIPSHIRGASSVCVPITEITDPWQLYREADGEVSAESFEVREHPTYWITVHFSTVPVVLLLLKNRVWPMPKMADLCARCGEALGTPVGGTRYLQWNQPGFAWTLHTDHDYEGVESRVHVPLITTPQNLFAWAPALDSKREDWLLVQHLERGRIYQTRTDIPHTAMNEHPTDGRLHLILDVGSPIPD
jgi:hypothetical protein